MHISHMNFLSQFPNCIDAEAISVACLNLHYYVNANASATGNEEECHHLPITLNDLQPEKELSRSKSLDYDGKCISVWLGPINIRLSLQLQDHWKIIRSSIWYVHHNKKCT